MESTQPQEQALFLLLQQGFDGSDKPPADVTAFPAAVLSWRAIDAELDRVSFDAYEPGDDPR